MLNIELILVNLLLYFFLDLVHSSIVITLNFGAFIVILGVIAKKTLLGWLEYLLELFQSQL